MNEIKEFYTEYADKIHQKRFSSPYAVRKYAHLKQYESVCSFVNSGESVLDVGCGEGTLTVMLSEKGGLASGTDISKPNVEEAKKYAKSLNLNIPFQVADLEHQPYPDESFDVVVCSHVLEHIPDFDAGLHELVRVAKKRVVFAVPTIFNLCSWVQVGGGQYYLKGPRSFASLPYGAIKMLKAYLTGQEGVDEGYAGNDVPHVFRFPSVVRKKLEKYGYILEEQEASTLALPFFESLLPISKKLDTLSKSLIFRNFGYGTTFVINKEKIK
jgi:ubiquinone/menaquinone biosynthesis C-methylase UbiE